MMDEYMRRYREQMDQVRLSDAADQVILNDLLKDNVRKGAPYMKRTKRSMSKAAAAAAVVIVFSVTAAACAAVVHRAIINSNKAESQVEGTGAVVDVGESSYYSLLAGNAGEVYVLTDNDCEGALTDHHAVAWKSTDQGETWEEILSQPDELNEESYLCAGDLREGEAGAEAVVIMEEMSGKAEEGYSERVYQITSDSYIEYDMEEVYNRLGDGEQIWDVKYVNDQIIALAGATGECLLYDVNTQKVVKSLPYDGTMGWLKTQDQFLIYGTEIYSCLNAETLEEEEPEQGLQDFVSMMFQKNNQVVLPPMAVWNDTVACVTKAGIYEYRDGEITQIRQLSNRVSNGYAFNGVLPFCRTKNGEYYVCIFSENGMSLWQIDGDE